MTTAENLLLALARERPEKARQYCEHRAEYLELVACRLFPSIFGGVRGSSATGGDCARAGGRPGNSAEWNEPLVRWTR